jgi:DGQHR domain-containing protein
MSLELRLPALEIKQSSGNVLYQFAVDGKIVPSFATVSRIRRNHAGGLKGYQRPEVLSHIAEIRKYLEAAKSPRIPNAVVIAFDSRVVFEPGTGHADTFSRPGTLIIPLLDEEAEEDHPGFIVDGQQRLAAIRTANIAHFPMPVTAFITNDVKEQTEQFILVNSTKPLPKGLIYELLPNTETSLPTFLSRRRFPALLLQRLNLDVESPLRGKIQTPTNPTGIIKDNSILKMLENSLADGVLSRITTEEISGAHGQDEIAVERMLETLKRFWGVVADTWGDAWDLPPRKSRLVHGAGILALGLLMDAIADRHAGQAPEQVDFSADLKVMVDACHWTSGTWELAPGVSRKWNELQNIPKDIELLSTYLSREYKKRVIWRG